MSITSKSPTKVAAAAYEAGKKALPDYAHKYSRQDFTCAQLFAILVLRKFFKQDYRTTVAFICEWSDLRDILDLTDKVPHYTTLQKSNAKLLNDVMLRKLLKQTLEQFYRYSKHAAIDDDDIAWVARVDQAAGDSTGFASNRCSAYFTKRRKQSQKRDDDEGKTRRIIYHRFPKLGIVVDCKSHIILSHVRGQGPRPDVDQLLPLMENMTGQVVPDQLLLDAGYDSEQNHEMLREYLEIESVIPAKIGRPTNKLPKGKWRRLMATHFDDESYGQRWQVETVMHMLKSRLGDALTARTYHARNREMGLMSLAHNLMIVRRSKGFLQSRLIPFSSPGPLIGARRITSAAPILTGEPVRSEQSPLIAPKGFHRK